MNKQFVLLLFLWLILSVSCLGQDMFVQHGQASFYADRFHGRLTASGEKYDAGKLTAAHLTLPFGTLVRVVNTDNNRSVTVRINDRGPFVEGRIIDLSKEAAEKLDFLSRGVAKVRIEVVSSSTTDHPDIIVMQENDTRRNEEFYAVTVQKITPSGYGVQVGSFAELANLMRVTDKLNPDLKRRVTVHVGVINQVKVYRIIIGQYQNREEAEKIRHQLSDDYPDAFIYTF